MIKELMLREIDNVTLKRYQDRIKTYKRNIFENNGVFLVECLYHENAISISFSDAYAGKNYIDRMMIKKELKELSPIKVKVWLTWFKSSKTIIHQQSIETQVDIREPGKNLVFKGLLKKESNKEL